MSRFENAQAAIREVHSNTDESLEAVMHQLEELRDLAQELVEAISADIEMQAS